MTPPGTSKTELLIFPENETFLRRFFRSIIATARLGHAPTLQYIVCNLPGKLELPFNGGGIIMPRTSNKAELIMDYVNQFIQENGYSPSVREIGAAVGLRSTASVSYHLQQLQEKGLLVAPGAKGRSYTRHIPEGC